MKNQTKSLYFTAAILFAVMLIPAQQVVAAPALVKNVDQPGRQPYEMWIEFGTSYCSFNCSNIYSYGGVTLFDGPAVPAGKRLIIQGVSASIPANSSMITISLQTSQILSNQYVKWQYSGPYYLQYTSGNSYGMSSPTFVEYGPGESPHLRIYTANPNSVIGNVTLNGYLIDAN
ncbi:hypothetical protein [Methylomonas sp. AM2-LC]|uniref:hypothetical protein n=1 Tax=Methylomonas sp. AM2-LC TaxID=3153301 RepID=UPI003265F3D0